MSIVLAGAVRTGVTGDWFQVFPHATKFFLDGKVTLDRRFLLAGVATKGLISFTFCEYCISVTMELAGDRVRCSGHR